jgi:hypothetical protein
MSRTQSRDRYERINRLNFERNVALQRLEHANREQNTTLQAQAFHQLSNINAELLEALMDHPKLKRPTTPNGDMKLVFSHLTPDGRLMSQAEFYQFAGGLTHEERECLTVVDVDPDSGEAVEDILAEDQRRSG